MEDKSTNTDGTEKKALITEEFTVDVLIEISKNSHIKLE